MIEAFVKWCLRISEVLPSSPTCPSCEASQAAGTIKALGIAIEIWAELNQSAKMGPSSNVQRCCLRKFGASGLPAFENSLCSYLQVSFFRSARPPKQLEFTEFWVLEPEHGQGWTIQQLIPFDSNFGVAWGKSIFGFRLPLIFQIGCKEGLHRWHGWCNRHRELDVQV